jgi:hypothetical protein
MTIRKILNDMKKPVPFWRAVEHLCFLGYKREVASDMIRQYACNTINSITGEYVLHDGMLFEPKNKHPFEMGVYFSKKQKLNGKYLILIPCNSGAFVADYFSAPSWKMAGKYFPERMTTMDFAATDSITTVSKDGKGLIVFENEMERVKGYDCFPTYSKEKLEECIEGMKVSLDRLKDYKHIFAYLNVRLYDEAFHHFNLPNVTTYKLGYKPGFFNGGMRFLRDVVNKTIDESDIL